MIPIELNIFFLRTYHFQLQAGLRRKRKGDVWIQVDKRDVLTVRTYIIITVFRPSRFKARPAEPLPAIGAGKNKI
jgi:hypothetical protein